LSILLSCATNILFFCRFLYFRYLLSRLPRNPISLLFPYTTLFRSMPSHPLFTDKTIALSATLAATIGLEEAVLLTVLNDAASIRSEEHTSELQSRENLVCRLLLEKKKYNCNCV